MSSTIRPTSALLARPSGRSSLPVVTRPRPAFVLQHVRGAKMWVTPARRRERAQDAGGALPDVIRLLKAAAHARPHAAVTLTLEPALKKSVNANVLKGRFVLPHPPPASAGADEGPSEVIALIVDEQNAADVDLARTLGVAHVGGQTLVDQIVAGEVRPTKLLCQTSQLARLLQSPATSKALGQRGLVPSAKRGTVGDDLPALVRAARTATDWALDPATQRVAVPVGPAGMELSKLETNIRAFVDRVAELAQTGKASSTGTPAKPAPAGRPTKRAGIKRIILSVPGTPLIAVS